MTTTVAVYARISADQEGLGLGVARQEADGRAIAQARGWTVHEAYIDQSVSAYKRQVKRPAFERMLVDLESGTVCGIAVYDIDRIARQPRDLERLIDIFEAKPSLVFATVQGDLNLATSDGRFMARLLVNVANKASADTGRRVARKAFEIAQAGRESGGGYRPFGYEQDRMKPKPEEADIIREAVRRVLATESLTSVCQDLNDRGAPHPGPGQKWHRSVLKNMLLRPRLAGIRVYKGDVLLDDQGKPVKAVWEAIITMEQHRDLVELFSDPSRNNNLGRIDRKYLLSGILRCKCGAKMYGVMKHGLPNYVCPTIAGCGGTHRRAEPIDEYLTELVLCYLEKHELPDEVDEVGEAVDEDIAEAERSLSALIAEWSAGRMSDQVFFTAQARKEAVVKSLKQQRVTAKRRKLHHSPVGGEVRSIWEAANVSQRRAIMSDVLLAVNVLAKPHSAPRKFQPEYLEPVWREEG